MNDSREKENEVVGGKKKGGTRNAKHDEMACFYELLIDGLPLFLTLLSLIRNVGSVY